MTNSERLTAIRKFEAKLNELPIPKKSVQLIGFIVHVTIAGHGETSAATANKWIAALSKLGKVSSKETIEEAHDNDRQAGAVRYVKVTKVWCNMYSGA